MHLLVGNVAALAVALIFYAWREYLQKLRRRRLLKERVTYMLWVMADRVDRPQELAAVE